MQGRYEIDGRQLPRIIDHVIAPCRGSSPDKRMQTMPLLESLLPRHQTHSVICNHNNHVPAAR